MAKHTYAFLNEDIIDGLPGRFLWSEGIEGSIRTIVRLRRNEFRVDEVVRVQRVGDYLNRFVGRLGIEVAGNDHRHRAGYLLYFFQEQFGTFAACGLANMIEMRVEMIKGFF